MKIFHSESIIKEIHDVMKKDSLSFDEMADHFESRPGFMDVYKKAGLSNTNLFVRQMYHSYNLKYGGEKVYFFSSDVCDLLLNTRLTIDSEFIESPFPAMYLYTDQTKLLLTDKTGTRPVHGVYLQLDRDLDGIKRMRFIATSGIEGIPDNKDINYFATIRVPEHGYLEDIVDSQIESFMDGTSSFILNDDINMKMMKSVIMFIINALLYIGCKNVDFVNFKPENLEDVMARKKNPTKRDKVERLFGRVSQIPYILVNPNKKYSQTEQYGFGKKLDHQVLVSGHWRGQWLGSEKDSTRRKEIIRIQSYVKGVDKTVDQNKPYIVQ